MLGNGRLKASCFDGEERMAHVGECFLEFLNVSAVLSWHERAAPQ